jgi:hypothetical protein
MTMLLASEAEADRVGTVSIDQVVAEIDDIISAAGR